MYRQFAIVSAVAVTLIGAAAFASIKPLNVTAAQQLKVLEAKPVATDSFGFDNCTLQITVCEHVTR